MSDENTDVKKNASQDDEPELPMPWQQVQSAIWLIGLAILFWQDWFWPGILVLSAISGLTQALMWWVIKRRTEQRQATQRRTDWLPSKCPPLRRAAQRGDGAVDRRRQRQLPVLQCASEAGVTQPARIEWPPAHPQQSLATYPKS